MVRQYSGCVTSSSSTERGRSFTRSIVLSSPRFTPVALLLFATTTLGVALTPDGTAGLNGHDFLWRAFCCAWRGPSKGGCVHPGKPHSHDVHFGRPILYA